MIARIISRIRRRRLYSRLERFTLPTTGVYVASYSLFVDPRD